MADGQLQQTQSASTPLPRVAIKYCTQCRWMLRAAYFAQELLSTFSTTLGEVALLPNINGTFVITLTYLPVTDGESRKDGSDTQGGDEGVHAKEVLIWDRKAEGGFPETKVLKQLIRDHIDPSKNLGHSDRGGKSSDQPLPQKAVEVDTVAAS